MKIEFKKGYFGGNMEALEAYVKKVQVLLSDGFGNVPKENKPYYVSFYNKTELGEFDEEPFLREELGLFQEENYKESIIKIMKNNNLL